MKIKINPKIFNEKYLQFFEDDTPTQIIFGSASSGKSYSILNFVVLWAIQGRAILITRKVARTIRKSVFNELSKSISNLKLTKYFDINKTELTITSRISEGSITCVGLDDAEKIKSITPPKASAFSVVLHEECTEISSDEYDMANSRMRGLSKYAKKVIMLFNPISKTHWIYKRFFDTVGWDDESDMDYDDGNVKITRCLYQDNRFLGKEEIERIERLRLVSPKFFRVYALGRFGITMANVFTNHIVGDFDIASVKHLELKFGIDWGYHHKSALTISYYDKVNRKIYVVAEIGVKNKTREQFIEDVINKLQTLNSTGLKMFNPQILADSAEPASIQHARNKGLNVLPAKKGPDSIKRSYDFLLSNQIHIHPSCTQLIEEMDTLYYDKDANGDYKEEPVNINDDLIASLRYSYSKEYSNVQDVRGFKANLY